MIHFRDNYEITKEKVRPEFLRYDQKRMIESFSLKYDQQFLYVPFAGNEYQICRSTAEVERLCSGTCSKQANYEEVLSIYDILCHGNPAVGIGTNWCLVNNLPGVGQNSGLGDNIVTDDARIVHDNPEAYCRACMNLGGRPVQLGDIGFEIPVFSFFPVRLRFYYGDDEFSPQLSVLFHDKTLQYMHYETTYYVVACLLRSIRQRMQ